MNSLKEKDIENAEEIARILSEYFANAESGRHQCELIRTIAKIDDDELSLVRKSLGAKVMSEIVGKLLLVAANISRHQICIESSPKNDDVEFLLSEFLRIGYKPELNYMDTFADCLKDLCRQNQLKIANPGQIFQLILDYFDIPNQLIYSALMNIFNNFMMWSLRPVNHQILHDTISTILKISWSSKKKYILLASIDMEVLKNHKEFNIGDIFNGLEFSLRLSHLLSPSQNLFAAIVKDTNSKAPASKHIADLLWNKDQPTVENIIKHRISVCDEDFRKRVAMHLQIEIAETDKTTSTTSQKFRTILRLKTVFQSHLQCPNVENLAKNFSCSKMDCSEKLIYLQYFMEMSVHHKDEYQRVESMLLLINFVSYNMNEDDSTFVDFFIKTFPRLLCAIEVKKNSMNAEVMKEIFGMLKTEIIDSGFRFGSYQTKSFSLKTLRTILKQFFARKSAKFGEHLIENNIFDKNDYLIQLLKTIQDEEDSDLGEICVELIKEFYIHENIRVIIKYLLETPLTPTRHPEFNDECDVSERVFKKLSSHEALRLEILKQEGKNAKALRVSLDDLSRSVDELQSNVQQILSDELNRTNPLFERLTNLTYLLKISASCDHAVMLGICELYNRTVDTILNLLNEFDIPMTFEVLNEKIQHLKLICSTDHSKNVILNFMFYTLRACSEFSSMLVDCWLNKLADENRDVYKNVIKSIITMNIRILTRCCHKGAIEAAREAIGKLTRFVSKTQVMNPADTSSIATLEILERSIQYDYEKVKDIRAARGLMFMIHEIITNHPAFINIYISSVLPESMEFSASIHPIQLHILAKLIKDSKVTNYVLVSYERILLATMKLFRATNEYVLCNGLLQVLGSLIPKISIQKRHVISNDSDDSLNDEYEYKDISARCFMTRFDEVFNSAKEDLSTETKSPGTLPSTYIVVILQILSAFENTYPSSEDTGEIMSVLLLLMNHRCDKIRMMAAKCASLWMPDNTESLTVIRASISNLFSANENLLIASTRFLTLAILRMSHSTIINVDSLKLELMNILIANSSRKNNFNCLSFYGRCYLMEFLLILGFKKNDEIFSQITCVGNPLSLYGYSLWRDKMIEL